MFQNNKNLIIIAIIAVVNALGYGIIIPILYSYSQRFGLSDFQNGFLFASYAVCAFLSTPVIGRLSDKYGRKPMLLISLFGTLVSFVMMALAPNAIFLFIARALDGLTAGNISVAQAVISDTTEIKDRAKGFGVIGASFGFGFIFGPIISATTLGFGIFVPFLISAAITTVALILIKTLLPETNKHIGEVKKGKVIDFHALFKMLFDPNVGLTLLVSLIYSFAFSLFMYGYQPVAVKVLHMTPTMISINFTLIGVMGLIAQAFLIPKISKRFDIKKILIISQITVASAFLAFYLANNFILYFIISVFYSLSNSFVAPLINTLLSREMDERSQGSILGINASYVSLGNIFGPIVGGVLATFFIPLPFLFGTGVILISIFFSFLILKKPVIVRDAF